MGKMSQFTEALITAANGGGLFPERKIQLKAVDDATQLILIAAAPRSGSTFLSNVLQQVTGLERYRLSSAYSTNEHDLYLPALCIRNGVGAVSQMHTKGTFHNAKLAKTFGIKPIILVRSIYDIVVSLRDDLRLKEQMENFGTGQDGYSFVWLDQDTKALDDETLIDLVIDLAVPWYVNFYVSWYRLCEQNAVNAKWVCYEDMMADKEGTVKDILDFLNFPLNGPIDDTVLERKYFTYNKAEADRGAKALTDDQKSRIKRLFSYYPTVDFSRFRLAD